MHNAQKDAWNQSIMSRARSAKNSHENVSIDGVAVSILGSPYKLSTNPLSPQTYTNVSDPNWQLLNRAPYPFHLYKRGSQYNRLCSRLLRTQSSRNKSALTSVKWFPDGRRLFVTTASGELTVWSGETFSLEDIKRLPASVGALTATEWIPDGSLALIGDWGGNIHLTSGTLSPVALLSDMQGHSIIGISSAPTGYKCVAVGVDAHPIIWDLRYHVKERTLSALGYDTVCIQWHPTKGLVATGTKSDQLAFWDPRDSHTHNVIMAHKGSLTALQFSPCGNWIATAGRDSLIRIWDLKTMTCLKELRAHSGNHDCRVTELIWHPIYHSQFLISGDSEGTVQYFDLSLTATNALNPLCKFFIPPLFLTLRHAHEQGISGMQYHPMGHVLTTVSTDGKLKIWAPPTKESYSLPVVDCSQMTSLDGS